MAGSSKLGRPPNGSSDDVQVRTFLIADVRGYTLFTQERGDEAAAKLAAKFATIAREVVEGLGGRLLELRGDEALCVFSSSRQAIRAAAELQMRFVDETIADPTLPLTVGIGLDAGEAVPVEDGYRGAALNLAARLCGQARAGEILASREATHLARRVDGVRYEERAALTLKGIDRPVAVVRVVVEDVDTVTRLAPYAPPPPRAPRKGRRRAAVVAAVVAVLALVALAIPLLSGGDEAVVVGANSIARLDPADGRVTQATALGERPGASAVGFGSVWVTQPDRGTVARLDATSGAVTETIRVGASPGAIAVGEGSVWVTNTGEGSVSRINPEANEVTQTLEVGSGPTGIAVGDGALWIADAVEDRLIRVDISSGGTSGVALAARPSGVAISPTGIWVTSSAAASIGRVDPETMQVDLEANVGNGPTSVLSAADSIWVANTIDATVSRLEPATGRVIATIPVGEGPSAIVPVAGSIWVSNELDGNVSVITPATNRVERTLDLGGDLASIAAGGDAVWVAVGASAASHRGGTLRIATREPISSLDPAVAYESESWQILSITNDGLVAYEKVGGAEGTTLVPDLAVSLPEVSRDGLTYRFVLRRGIRYSTGDPVLPEDFRYALERAFSLSDSAARIYTGFDGAAACFRDPAGCDLSSQVEVAEDTVTFHLARPDPDLPYKLGLPFAMPVPVGTPMEDQGLAGVAATGPYLIDHADETGVVLERNPSFREWSSAAQPDGFVDRIEWTFGIDPAVAVERLEAGEIDWTPQNLLADSIEQIAAAHPDRLIRAPNPTTIFLGFGLNAPPFDDVRVRQAVNYAIDRGRVVDLLGGPTSHRPTCQILPPNFQGYEPFCPYTLDPGSDTWTAPDLDRARELVAAAGVRGAGVEIWQTDIPFLDDPYAVPRYVAGVLNDLGFRARVHVVPDIGEYFGLISDVDGNGIQMYMSAWLADYPGAGGFIDVQFRCRGLGNTSGLCSSKFDVMIDEAQRLQLTDPAASNAAWAQVDRALVREAVWVPLTNPIDSYAFSDRVENVQIHPQWSVLLSRLWVT